MTELRNATIKSADVVTHDYSNLPVLTVEFEGKGWGVGYPAYRGHLADHIDVLLQVAGVSSLSACKGRPVRVEIDGGMFSKVFHFLDDTVCLDPTQVGR